MLRSHLIPTSERSDFHEEVSIRNVARIPHCRAVYDPNYLDRALFSSDSVEDGEWTTHDPKPANVGVIGRRPHPAIQPSACIPGEVSSRFASRPIPPSHFTALVGPDQILLRPPSARHAHRSCRLQKGSISAAGTNSPRIASSKPSSTSPIAEGADMNLSATTTSVACRSRSPYRISSFMARSRPSRVRGYMRFSIMSWTSLMEGVQPQWASGTGLSHTQCS
jgi:hypothetical protein